MYDALTDGHHGQREDCFCPGYKFRVDLHSFKGWVPHSFIYAWIKANGGMGMTPEVFWNTVLYTKGNKDGLHSYRV
eukprot:8743099-Heterocapsa_arctica.AAC.1